MTSISEISRLCANTWADVVAGALAAAGWQNVTADIVPARKNFTFSHPDHMFSGGERGGPLATYLVTASERKNFKLITDTSVNRVIRSGGKITGVEIEAFLKGGQCGTVEVKPTGSVILSAGAFGTPKILFRSGIGPQDQLEIVKKAEPPRWSTAHNGLISLLATTLMTMSTRTS